MALLGGAIEVSYFPSGVRGPGPGSLHNSSSAATCRQVQGLQSARRVLSHPFGVSRPRNPAKKAGLVFESHASSLLALEFGPAFTPSPWFRFFDDNGPGMCCPDGLVRLGSTVIIIETKIRHSARAWDQLVGLYLPVVSMALSPPSGGAALSLLLVELTKSYDPSVPWPEVPAAICLSWAELWTQIRRPSLGPVVFQLNLKGD